MLEIRTDFSSCMTLVIFRERDIQLEKMTCLGVRMCVCPPVKLLTVRAIILKLSARVMLEVVKWIRPNTDHCRSLRFSRWEILDICSWYWSNSCHKWKIKRRKNIDSGWLRSGCYSDLRGRKWWEAVEDCITRCFKICTLHQVLFGWSNEGG